MTRNKGSLCWDCARATKGSCSWSRRFAPVKGWTAEKRQMAGTNTTPPVISYRVYACPLFNRDSYAGGQVRPGTKEAKRYELAMQRV